MELLRQLKIFLFVVLKIPIHVFEIRELGRKYCNRARFDAAWMIDGGVESGDRSKRGYVVRMQNPEIGVLVSFVPEIVAFSKIMLSSIFFVLFCFSVVAIHGRVHCEA